MVARSNDKDTKQSRSNRYPSKFTKGRRRTLTFYVMQLDADREGLGAVVDGGEIVEPDTFHEFEFRPVVGTPYECSDMEAANGNRRALPYEPGLHVESGVWFDTTKPEKPSTVVAKVRVTLSDARRPNQRRRPMFWWQNKVGFVTESNEHLAVVGADNLLSIFPDKAKPDIWAAYVLQDKVQGQQRPAPKPAVRAPAANAVWDNFQSYLPAQPADQGVVLLRIFRRPNNMGVARSLDSLAYQDQRQTLLQILCNADAGVATHLNDGIETVLANADGIVKHVRGKCTAGTVLVVRANTEAMVAAVEEAAKRRVTQLKNLARKPPKAKQEVQRPAPRENATVEEQAPQAQAQPEGRRRNRGGRNRKRGSGAERALNQARVEASASPRDERAPAVEAAPKSERAFGSTLGDVFSAMLLTAEVLGPTMRGEKAEAAPTAEAAETAQTAQTEE